MTTLRKELRTKFEEIVISYGVQCSVEVDLASIFADAALEIAGIKSAAQRREEAEKRIAEQRAKRKEPVDFLLEHGSEIQMLNDMRIRVEAATGLGLSREWDKPRSTWNGYEKILIKREVETGQTIEQFMEWYKSDDFRKTGSIWLTADKIEMWWNSAFEQVTDCNAPRML